MVHAWQLLVVFKNDPVEQLKHFVDVVMQVIQFELQVLQTFVLFKNDPIEQLEQFVEGE